MQFRANRVMVHAQLGVRGSRSFEWGGWPAAKRVLILTVLAGVATMIAKLIEFVSGAELGLLKEPIIVVLVALGEALRQFIADFSGTVEVEVPRDS